MNQKNSLFVLHMDINTKKQAFEYWLTQMLKWGNEMTPKVSFYSFTRLKALKLLFFTAAVKNNDDSDLLDIFDNFYALPNGPVESDIYNYITADQLTYYTFNNFSFAEKRQFCDNGLSSEVKQRINNAIVSLRNKNEKIVAYNAESLVMLSHTWLSWQSAIQIAQALGKGSYKMDVKQIRGNAQTFAL